MRSFVPMLAAATLAVVLVAGAGALDPGRSATAKSGGKKLIEMGWDEPDPAFMRAHTAQMDATPFDGCVFHVPYRTAAGKTGLFTKELWGPVAFTDADLAPALADLKATRFTRLRWNFLRVNIAPGTVGWFDDPATVLSNLRLAARVAKAGGAAGIMFDTEPYGKELFCYRDLPNPEHKNYAVFAAQVRRRGADVMRAFEQGDPGLTVFLTLGATQTAIESLWAKQGLDSTRFGLLAPFVDGMISAASDSARIVDGMEPSYPARKPSDLDHYVLSERHEVLHWISDPVRYQRIVSLGFALWLDHDWQHRGWHVTDPDSNYRTPAALESTLTRALQLCDEYTWLYSETPDWWTAAGGPKKLPEAYVTAVRQARRAAGLAP